MDKGPKFIDKIHSLIQALNIPYLKKEELDEEIVRYITDVVLQERLKTTEFITKQIELNNKHRGEYYLDREMSRYAKLLKLRPIDLP